MRIVHSSLASTGSASSSAEFNDWFSDREVHDSMTVERIPFEAMKGWRFTAEKKSLAHDSGRFFSVEGVRVIRNGREMMGWAQPIINQPEVGILGYLVKEFDGVLHFLVQAKIEPGNLKQLQLSPTVQATRSNYTKVHGGASTPYLEYFLQPSRGRVIADVLQSEQGSWFLRKRNRNMIVETTDDVPVRENFYWLALGQVRELLAQPNLINMDSRSVLSCLPMPTSGWPEGGADDPGTEFGTDLRRSICATDLGCCHTKPEIFSWLNDVRTGTDVSVEPVPLAALPDWELSPLDIAHRHDKYFRIIGVSVQTGQREVSTWSQPLLAPCGIGIIAFLTRRIDGVLHVLVRAAVQPGFHDVVELGPTVQCNPANYADLPPGRRPLFLDYVLGATDNVRYDVLHSEEGGRFYRAEGRYMLVAIDDLPMPEQHPDFRWMTIGQLLTMQQHHNYLNVEARGLIACLHSLW
jgi:oxidase EvaA